MPIVWIGSFVFYGLKNLSHFVAGGWKAIEFYCSILFNYSERSWSLKANLQGRRRIPNWMQLDYANSHFTVIVLPWQAPLVKFSRLQWTETASRVIRVRYYVRASIVYFTILCTKMTMDEKTHIANPRHDMLAYCVLGHKPFDPSCLFAHQVYKYN